MTLRTLLVAVLATTLGLATTVSAQTTAGPAASLAAGPGALAPAEPLRPDEIVRSGVDRLAGFLIGARGASPEAVRAFLDHAVAPSFDFDYMATWAAGPLKRRLDEADMARLGAKLRELFLDALARNLGGYARTVPQVRVHRARGGRNARESVVPARVVTDSGFTARLEFRLYWTGHEWKIFDVAANGASAVAYYRRYFGDLLRRHGPRALGD